jgi:hypothetical protein
VDVVLVVRIDEADYEDDIHGNAEDVSFLVLEAGSWQLGDGTRLEVGTHTTDSLTTGAGFEPVSFADGFDAAPSVFSQVQTVNDPSFVQTRQQNADGQGFELALEHEEARANVARADEQVGWFAIEEGTGTWDGHAFQAGSTGDAVTDEPFTLAFDDSLNFDQAPQFFAQLASFDGPDAAHVRYDSLSADQAGIRVHEGESLDSETNHTDEHAAFLAVQGAGTLTGTVHGSDTAPDLTAGDDTVGTDEDTAVTVGVLDNDSGAGLSISAVGTAGHGTVEIADAAAGDLVYTPQADFNGADSFTYTVQDDGGATATATVSVSVAPVNDAPQADDDTATTPSGTAVEIDVLANDSDLDGDALTIQSAGAPATGSVTVNDGSGTGADTLTYVPADGFTGTDSFSYTVSDGNGGTAEASVAVTVESRPPVAQADSAETTAGTAVEIDVLANDSDPEGDPLSLTGLADGPAHGSVTVNDGGGSGPDTLTYTPDAGFTGSDSFRYTVRDGNGGTAEADVEVSVSDNGSGSDGAQTIGELGRITDLDHNVQTVQLAHSFANPVVFATTPSMNGLNYSTVQVTDVQSDSFSARIDEAEYENDIHDMAEDVSFLVLEAGSWQLGDGSRLEVGTHTTDSLTTGAGFEPVSFVDGFDAAPSVFSQVQTVNDPSFVQTRQQNVDGQGFELALEHEEARANVSRADEQVGWFAIEEGTGTWDGHAFQAGSTGNAVTDEPFTLAFDDSLNFDQAPQFFAQLASFDGPDTAHVRYDSLSADQAGIRVHEEQSADQETAHWAEESINFLSISGMGPLEGDIFV